MDININIRGGNEDDFPQDKSLYDPNLVNLGGGHGNSQFFNPPSNPLSSTVNAPSQTSSIFNQISTGFGGPGGTKPINPGGGGPGLPPPPGGQPPLPGGLPPNPPILPTPIPPAGPLIVVAAVLLALEELVERIHEAGEAIRGAIEGSLQFLVQPPQGAFSMIAGGARGAGAAFDAGISTMGPVGEFVLTTFVPFVAVVQESFETLATTAEALDQAMMALVEDLKIWSGDIIEESVQNKIRMLDLQRERADRLGPTLADYEEARGEIEREFYKASTEILEQILPLVVMIAQNVALLLQVSSTVSSGVINVVGSTGGVAGTVTSGFAVLKAIHSLIHRAFGRMDEEKDVKLLDEVQRFLMAGSTLDAFPEAKTAWGESPTVPHF